MNKIAVDGKNKSRKLVTSKYKKLAEKYNIPYEKLKRIVQPSQKTAKTDNILLAQDIAREFPGVSVMDVLTRRAIIGIYKRDNEAVTAILKIAKEFVVTGKN